jgi:aquaporin Z
MSTTAAVHWREYAIEAAALGAFMVSAATMTVTLEHPSSPARAMIADPHVRRLLMGVAMGLTAAAIIYSPWGRRSGAHLNPAVTLTFLRLGKVTRRDALAYILAQLTGGVLGMAIAALLLAPWIADPHVNYVITAPGAAGDTAAFVAEAAISFLLMLTVLTVSNQPALARFTGLAAALLVATFITLEAPLSGMSMNPARSLGPDVVGGSWRGLWIYFVAPPLGMLAAAQLFVAVRGRHAVRCAKMHHDDGPCIFGCDRTPPGSQSSVPGARFVSGLGRAANREHRTTPLEPNVNTN